MRPIGCTLTSLRVCGTRALRNSARRVTLNRKSAMSIIGDSGLLGVSKEVWGGLVVLGFTALSIAIFIRGRGYRLGLIRGPQRLPADEPIWPLVFILFGGMSIWAFVPFAILRYLHRHEPMSAKIEMTSHEKVIVGIVAGVVPLFFILLGTKTRRERGMEKLGLRGRDLPGAIGPAIAAGACVIPLVYWTARFTQWLLKKLQKDHPLKHELLEIMDVAPSPWIKVAVVVGAVVVAPLFEEVVFRGYLQTLFLRIFRVRLPEALARWLAVIGASLLFTLVHEWPTWLPIFVLSVCLGYMYERTGKLWTSILMHALFNAISVIGSSSWAR